MSKNKSFNNYIYYTRILLVFTFFLLIQGLLITKAQNSTNSPYSRFGIGDLNSITFARNLALGGTEIGLNQPLSINYGNPAAYSNLWFTTYEAGADFKQYEFKNSSAVHRSHTASLSYFDFAFPIKAQKWSLGFGLLPYSNVGYSITENKTTDFGDSEIRNYQGSGGLNNFHIGSGIKLNKKLSFGVNTEYLFGSLNNNRKIYFLSPFYFDSEINKSTSIGSFHFKTGLQYSLDSLPFAKSDSVLVFEKKICALQDSLAKLINDNRSDTTSEKYELKNKLTGEIALAQQIKESIVTKKVKSDWHLVLGLVATPATNLTARNSTIVKSFRYFQYQNPESGTLVKDTILNIESEQGDIHLPFGAGFGLSLRKGSRWLFCADYSLQNWSNFSFLGQQDSLVNSWKVSAGIQYTPDDRSVKSYWKIMQYRLGFHYDRGFIKLNGTNISEIGLSAGFALPVRKAGTVLHFTFEGGNRGTTGNNLVLERFLKFTIGFTINDKWFMKPKYD